MKRREFLGAVAGAAAAWPLSVRAQKPALVGFLQPGSPADSGHYVAAFLAGLGETGHREGDSFGIEYRWAEGRYEQLPQLAADLVARGVAVIAAGGPPAVLAAKSATSTVPIVFISDDVVSQGLVGSLSRPGGNLTGVSVFETGAIWGKRLGLLHELIPGADPIAMLVDPEKGAELATRETVAAAGALGMRISFVTTATDRNIEEAFASASRRGFDAFIFSSQPFFTVRHDAIVALAARYAVPAMYGWPEYVAAGGLISYGSRLSDAWHQLGV
ncbi:MAG TPA: ABC transporter substrate-binding protein, partial [Alphaproteobacteria bacterium]